MSSDVVERSTNASRGLRQRAAQAWFTDPALREISRAYDERETAASRELALAIALADLGRRPHAILDVGSGDGEGLLLAGSECPAATLTGIDPSPEAQADLSALGARDARVFTAKAEAIPEEVRHRGPFDLILVHLNWALWEDPVEGVRALGSLLSADGLLYIVDLEGSGASAISVASTAQSPDEARYLADQVAASYTEHEAREALGPLAAELLVEVSRGGLGGFAFDRPQAAAYARNVSVLRALRAFPPSDSSDAADAILHARIRRRPGCV